MQPEASSEHSSPSSSGWKRCRVQVAIDHVDTDGALEYVDPLQQDRRWVYEANRRLREQLRAAGKQSSTMDDILQLVPLSEFEGFRQYFTPAICKADFIEMLSSAVQKNVSGQSKVQTLAAMLFDSIDIDGSGRLSWEEFSSYLLFQYTEASAFHLHGPEAHRYIAASKGADHGNIHSCQLRYIADLDQFIVVEVVRSPTRRSSVYLMQDPSSTTKTLVDVMHGTETSHFLAAEYLPWARWMMCSTDGHFTSTLHFYKCQKGKQDCEAERMPIIKHWNIFEAHDLLKAEPETQTVFASGRFGHLTGYRVEHMESSECTAKVAYRSKPHSAALADIIFITTGGSKRIATCGLDGAVKLQDVDLRYPFAELGSGNSKERRHQQGVLTLAYNEDRNLLFSGGFEQEIYAWVPVEMKDPLVCKYYSVEKPHTDKIIKIESAGTHTFISTDFVGNLRVWDVRMTGLVDSFNVADAETQHTKLQVFSQAYDATRQNIVVMGRDSRSMSCRLYSFSKSVARLSSSLTHDESVGLAIYQSTSKIFVTTTGTTLKVWDATTGHLHREFRSLARTHITAVCFDISGQKYIIGTHGGTLTVHSTNTGMMTFEYKDLPSEVISICYLSNINCVAVASADKYVRLYRYDGTHPEPFIATSHERGLTRILYCRPLAMALVVDDHETVYVYSIRTGRPFEHQFTCCFSKAQQISRFFSDRRPTKGSGQALRLQWKTASISPKEQHDEQVEDDCRLRGVSEIDATLQKYLQAKDNEIACVSFIHPFAAFVMGDTAGYLVVWQLRGQHANKPVLRWQMGNGNDSGPSPCAMDWVEALGWLCVGDSEGGITVWDVATHLTDLKIPVTLSTNSEDWGTLTPHVPSFARPVPLKKKMSLVAPALVKRFTVCAKDITFLQVCPPYTDIMAVSGGTISLWSVHGEKVGELRHHQPRPHSATRAPSADSVPWRFGRSCPDPTHEASGPENNSLPNKIFEKPADPETLQLHPVSRTRSTLYGRNQESDHCANRITVDDEGKRMSSMQVQSTSNPGGQSAADLRRDANGSDEDVEDDSADAIYMPLLAMQQRQMTPRLQPKFRAQAPVDSAFSFVSTKVTSSEVSTMIPQQLWKAFRPSRSKEVTWPPTAEIPNAAKPLPPSIVASVESQRSELITDIVNTENLYAILKGTAQPSRGKGLLTIGSLLPRGLLHPRSTLWSPTMSSTSRPSSSASPCRSSTPTSTKNSHARSVMMEPMLGRMDPNEVSLPALYGTSLLQLRPQYHPPPVHGADTQMSAELLEVLNSFMEVGGAIPSCPHSGLPQ